MAKPTQKGQEKALRGLVSAVGWIAFMMEKKLVVWFTAGLFIVGGASGLFGR